MSTRPPLVCRFALAFVVTALGACSDDTMTAFPDEDASDQDAPSFDIPTTDTGTDTGFTDRANADVSVSRDRGTSETTVCPASCAASPECDPCRTADTPSTVQYCCISGLCVFMTGTCPTLTDGGMGDAMGDGAADGAADGATPGGDVPDPDDGGGEEDVAPPPVDAGPASDLGGDARTDGAADAVADAPARMDAADGGG